MLVVALMLLVFLTVPSRARAYARLSPEKLSQDVRCFISLFEYEFEYPWVPTTNLDALIFGSIIPSLMVSFSFVSRLVKMNSVVPKRISSYREAGRKKFRSSLDYFWNLTQGKISQALTMFFVRVAITTWLILRVYLDFLSSYLSEVNSIPAIQSLQLIYTRRSSGSLL
jgi:hypothetical protein